MQMAIVTMSAGSQRVAEKLAVDMKGKVFLEDAGFDWKILGPDVADVDYVAWQCDQDAYACSGQKCSAQSVLFAHEAWRGSGLLKAWGERARARKLENLTVGPVITVTTERMLAHVQRLLEIPGALTPPVATFRCVYHTC
jgi:1-pyrroline-5-carboxylate dehydrogenase